MTVNSLVISHLRPVLNIKDQLLLVNLTKAIVSRTIITSCVLQRHRGNDVTEVRVNEAASKLPLDPLCPGLAVHLADHLCCLLQLHSVGIDRTHRDHWEI